MLINLTNLYYILPNVVIYSTSTISLLDGKKTYMKDYYKLRISYSIHEHNKAFKTFKKAAE